MKYLLTEKQMEELILEKRLSKDRILNEMVDEIKAKVRPELREKMVRSFVENYYKSKNIIKL